MGVISTFETPEKITEKERYELDKFAFVEGTNVSKHSMKKGVNLLQ